MLGSRADSERAAAGTSRPAAAGPAASEDRFDSPDLPPEGEITDDDIPF
jgi:hypothetical protein